MIPYGRQDITQADIDAVIEVLKADFITQGPQVPVFEGKLAGYCGADHAVAVNSATSALHIACLALGLGPQDWLWTSPVTFVASANCGLYCGARIDFVDINPDTFNLCPKALEAKLEQAALENRLPKIVVPVHLCGQPCEMQTIRALAEHYRFSIIEDASHAVGGRYREQQIGNCRYSDITIFSFHPVKIITTTEGGLALTNNRALADKMALYRSHGITRDPALMSRQSDGSWYYEQIALGFNYRMTELQAALGISQFKRLDDYVVRRREIAARYDNLLADLPLRQQFQPNESYSAYHLYVIRLDLSAVESTHKQVFETLREHGIGVNLHYIPVHLQPYYRQMGFGEGDFPNAESHYAEAISLPLFPTLTEDQQETIIRTLNSVLSNKSSSLGN